MATQHSVEELIYLMKLCDQAERYDDMAAFAKDFIAQKKQLTADERNLISVGFKNAIGARRTSWRVIVQIIQKEETKENSKHLVNLKENQKTIESELNEWCSCVLDLLDSTLIKNAQTSEETIFYLKMKGDYSRYMAEYQTDEALEQAKTLAIDAYKAAMELTNKELKTTNPIRLGLALNLSVFHYEILNDVAEACNTAKQAFDDAIRDIDLIDEDAYKDATAIMQLIRDNLTLWASATDQQEEVGVPAEKVQ